MWCPFCREAIVTLRFIDAKAIDIMPSRNPLQSLRRGVNSGLGNMAFGGFAAVNYITAQLVSVDRVALLRAVIGAYVERKEFLPLSIPPVSENV